MNVRAIRERLTGPSSERGTSLVEYALLVSLVTTGSLGTFEMMDERVEEHYEESAADIGEPDLSAFDRTDPDSPTPTTAAPSTTTSTTTTTTAAPPVTSTSTTTTSTTTSTTSTTTTTEPPATTTTAAPPSENASVAYKDSSGWRNDGTARAKVRLTIDDDEGDDLEYATVIATFTLAGGETQVITGTTNNKGKVTFEWTSLGAADFPVQVSVDSVELDGTSYTPGLTSHTLELD